MRGFLSFSQHKVDKKGRVSVPVSFRVSLEAEGRSFICFPSMLGNWLQAVTPKQMQAFIEQQKEASAFVGKINAYTSLLFAQAVEMSPDSDGRIVLPPELLAHAKIAEDAAFVGQGQFFSIWAPEVFAAEQDRLRKEAAAEIAGWLAPPVQQNVAAGASNG